MFHGLRWQCDCAEPSRTRPHASSYTVPAEVAWQVRLSTVVWWWGSEKCTQAFLPCGICELWAEDFSPVLLRTRIAVEKAFVTATANSLGWACFSAKDSKKGSCEVKKIGCHFQQRVGMELWDRTFSEDWQPRIITNHKPNLRLQNV